MTVNLDWDDEVDVVCTDAGIAGLAAALSADAEGADVFVAGAPAVVAGTQASWFGPANPDAQTASYLTALVADIDVAALRQTDADLPVRLVDEPALPRTRQVPPLIGSRLRDWAARCIPSPTGYLYTRVTDWPTDSAESDGDAIEIAEVGTMTPDPDNVSGSVLDWLTAEARERSIRVHRATLFARLVFEEGVVTGAVFTTADGPLAVRARHGVLVCRAHQAGAVTGRPAVESAQMRVALVGKTASRFGRVELLTADPAAANAAALWAGPTSERADQS